MEVTVVVVYNYYSSAVQSINNSALRNVDRCRCCCFSFWRIQFHSHTRTHKLDASYFWLSSLDSVKWLLLHYLAHFTVLIRITRIQARPSFMVLNVTFECHCEHHHTGMMVVVAISSKVKKIKIDCNKKRRELWDDERGWGKKAKSKMFAPVAFANATNVLSQSHRLQWDPPQWDILTLCAHIPAA